MLSDMLYTDETGRTVGLDEVQLLDAIPERVPSLERALSGSDEYLAYQAALVLAAWGRSSGVDYLRRMLSTLSSGLALDPNRLSSDDESLDRAVEAVHLYSVVTGDTKSRDECYADALRRYGSVRFQGRLQSALRRDKPRALLELTAKAYRRCLATNDKIGALLLLPCLVAMSDPHVWSRIEALEPAAGRDSGVVRDILSASQSHDDATIRDRLRAWAAGHAQHSGA